MRISVLIAVLLAAACGVQPSGVIPGVPAPRLDLGGVTLFFVANGKLTAVDRPTSGQPAPAETLAMLAAGPIEPGLTTEVPRDLGPLDVTGRTVTVSADVTALSTMAVAQIVCTARADTVTGQGQTRGPVRCPLG
jgi:hypothetical protein